MPDIRPMFTWSNNLFSFSSNKARKKIAQKLIYELDLAKSSLMFEKVYNCWSCFIIFFIFYQKYTVVVQPSIRPDIRYPAFGLAGYPVGRISGNNKIRCVLSLKSITLLMRYCTRYIFKSKLIKCWLLCRTTYLFPFSLVGKNWMIYLPCYICVTFSAIF
jgi:hypothetical protein